MMENKDTCDSKVKNIDDLLVKDESTKAITDMSKLPPGAITDISELPPGAITDISELQLGKSYKIYKMVDFELGKVEKCGEMIKRDTINAGFIKSPYYLVPTLKNRVASIFGMGGGKKSRKYRKKRRHTRRRKSRRNSRK